MWSSLSEQTDRESTIVFLLFQGLVPLDLHQLLSISSGVCELKSHTQVLSQFYHKNATKLGHDNSFNRGEAFII